MKDLIKQTIEKLVSSFQTQLSQWWIERKREKYDRTIHVVTEGKTPKREKSSQGWLGNSSVHAYSKKHKMPVHLLPNVKTFKIAMRTFDVVFKLLGIDRKHKPEIRIITLSKQTAAMNRYVVYQFRRMDKHKSPWVIGEALIKRSISFRLMGLRHVLPNWYRETKLTEILHILARVSKLAKRRSSKIDFRRVYIPKANGKLRPLGVPKVWWRIYLHQWQCITSWNVRHILSPNQHGFQPQKGVLTAWTDIMNRVIDKKYIYEFDIKGFFDNIEWPAMLYTMVMAEPRVPPEVREYFQDLMDSRPKIGVPMMPEISLDIEQALNKEQTMKEETIAAQQTATSIQGIIKGKQYIVTSTDPNIHSKPPKPTGIHWTGPSPVYPQTGLTHQQLRWRLGKGVPQGSPLSPILSILALEIDMKDNITVQYADDGLKAEDYPFEFKLNDFTTYYGAEIEPSKSGWVKYDGKWLKPLKFLGMEYDGVTNTFRAQTRNGATLEFSGGPSAIPELIEALERLDPGDYIPGKGSAEGTKLGPESLAIEKNVKISLPTLFGSEFYGFFFSRMQCDAWNIQIPQDFSIAKGLVKDSWLYKQELAFLGPALGQDDEAYLVDSSGELSYYPPVNPAKTGWFESLRATTTPWVRSCFVRMAKWGGLVELTTFNASSYAYHDLALKLKNASNRSLK